MWERKVGSVRDRGGVRDGVILGVSCRASNSAVQFLSMSALEAPVGSVAWRGG